MKLKQIVLFYSTMWKDFKYIGVKAEFRCPWPPNSLQYNYNEPPELVVLELPYASYIGNVRELLPGWVVFYVNDTLGPNRAEQTTFFFE